MTSGFLDRIYRINEIDSHEKFNFVNLVNPVKKICGAVIKELEK